MDDMGATPEPPKPERTFRLKRTPLSRELSEAAKAWLKQNQAAIDEFNRWDEEHGSPLDEYREHRTDEFRDIDGPL